MIKSLLTAAALAAGTPALAQDLPTATVRYADLDLTTSEGISEFDRRLTRAVNTVCPDALGPYIQEIAAAQACKSSTWGKAKERRAAILAAARTDPAHVAVASR